MKILIVEDERITLNAIKLIVESAGHVAILSDRSEEALELARTQRPQVALVDLKMKGSEFDGLELIRRLRADPLTEGMVVLAHTASASSPSLAAALQAGANDVIAKPFRQADLVALLDRNLTR